MNLYPSKRARHPLGAWPGTSERTITPALLACAAFAALICGLPARACADGDLDVTFQSQGRYTNFSISVTSPAIAVDASAGMLTLVTSAEIAPNQTWFRLLVPDGSPAVTCGVFGFHPAVSGERPYALVAQGTSMIAAGSTASDEAPLRRAVLTRDTACGEDPSFGTDGKLILDFGSVAKTEFRAVTIQADSKILAVGSLETYPNEIDFLVVRRLADGTPDPGFTGTFPLATGAGLVGFDAGAGTYRDRAAAVALQSDGKIVVAGTIDYGTATAIALVRINANGTNDYGFGALGTARVVIETASPIGSPERAGGVAVLPDGRIVVGGTSDLATGSKAVVAILLPNGLPDPGFGDSGVFLFDYGDPAYLNTVDALAVKEDRIVVAGSTGPDTFLWSPDFAVARLRTTGSAPLDTSFSDDGVTTIAFDVAYPYSDIASSLAIDLQAGRIYVAGRVQGGGTVGLGVAALEITVSAIFSDGFESGGLTAWSSSVP